LTASPASSTLPLAMTQPKGEPTFRGAGDTKRLPLTRRKYRLKAPWLLPTGEAMARAREEGRLSSRATASTPSTRVRYKP
jgi:hypothetical protein